MGEKTLKMLTGMLEGQTLKLSEPVNCSTARDTLFVFPSDKEHGGIYEYTIVKLRAHNPSTVWVIARRGPHNYEADSSTHHKDEYLTTGAGNIDAVLIFDCPAKAAEHMAKVLSPPAELKRLHWVTSCGCKGKRIS